MGYPPVLLKCFYPFIVTVALKSHQQITQRKDILKITTFKKAKPMIKKKKKIITLKKSKQNYRNKNTFPQK